MSEIQALTSSVKDLSGKVDFWNLLMIWGLIVTAGAAVFMVVATRIVVTRTGQLSEAQKLLSDAKDRESHERMAFGSLGPRWEPVVMKIFQRTFSGSW
jgi:hypothetical protein